MPPSPRLHFVLDPRSTRWPDIDRLTEDDIERAPRRFVGGRNSWIAQSFVRLRAALETRGWSASAGPGFVANAINVAHRDDANDFRIAREAPFLVVVRADRGPVTACDYAIVQNDLGHRAHERFVPLWPQPGLLARDISRGHRIESVVYHGRTGSAPAWFGSAELREALAWRGVRFEIRESRWNDYTTVDLALAARDELPGVLAHKPATKVYNGWLAGAAVLASPEPAYRAIRRSPLDFLDVRDAADVVAAVDFLRSRPEIYTTMVAHGRQRAREFDVAAVRQRWLQLLDEEILPAFLARSMRGRRLRFVAAMARQKVENRAYRMRLAIERAARESRHHGNAFIPTLLRGSDFPQLAK